MSLRYVPLLDSESYKRAERAAAVLSSDIVRWDAISLVSSGVVWIGSNFVAFSVADPTTGAGRSYFALYVVALLLLVLGFIGLHELQKASYGGMGRVGFYAVVVASLAQVLGLVVFLAGSSALLWLVSRVGTLRRCYLTSGDICVVVRRVAPLVPTRFVGPNIVWEHVLWSGLAGAGLRAVDG